MTKKEYDRQYRASHKEEINKRGRAHYAANRQRLIVQHKRYNETHQRVANNSIPLF